MVHDALRPGESLRDRLLRDGPLPVHEAIRITLEISQALSHAHKQRIVHRDVKPENILLTEDGSTLVADFGIARALDGPGEQELTVTGVIVGTPKYMAPEQLTGGADARVDEYAVAETCFEMLTGKPPFGASGQHSSSLRRTSDRVPNLRAIRPEVPAGVQDVLDRALAFDPESRFSSIAEFARALEAGKTEATHTAPQAPKVVTRGRVIWAIGVVVLGVIAVVSASLFNRRSPSSTATAASRPDAAVRRVVVLPFENQGDAADAYFADGMADEVEASSPQSRDSK